MSMAWLKSPLIIQWWFLCFYSQLTVLLYLGSNFIANNGPMSTQISSLCKWAVRPLEWTGNRDGPLQVVEGFQETDEGVYLQGKHLSMP